MALKSPLGFGMMRLPVKGGPTDFDYELLFKMVDAFLEAGFTYFDTSYVYHEGTSEEAARKAIVERHPRDSFTLATKFPSFIIKEENEIEPIFESQLARLGTGFIDYYLLHNVQTVYYDGIDGNGGVIKTCRLFEHAAKWKAEGKIGHLGFSFHSSAALLDRILAEHPEVEFVQIPLNYIDWESEFVQAKKSYEVIQKHGKKVVIMEPVKGGGLSQVPESVAGALRQMNPDASIASWAMRFAGSMDGVICTLSGMSTLEQVMDNINTVKNLSPLTEEEKQSLLKIVPLYKDAGPVGANLSRYEGLTLHGAPVTGILEAYNMCLLQPDSAMSDDNNYLKNVIAEKARLDCFAELPQEKVILADGTDATEYVLKAEKWLIEHSF